MKIHSIKPDYIGASLSAAYQLPYLFRLRPGCPFDDKKRSKRLRHKGQIVGDVLPGREVILVEDVTTTGGSVIKAIHALRNEGLVIHRVITVVDREEGATGKLASNEVELIPLVRMNELLKNKSDQMIALSRSLSRRRPSRFLELVITGIWSNLLRLIFLAHSLTCELDTAVSGSPLNFRISFTG